MTRDGCLEKIEFLPTPLNPDTFAKPMGTRPADAHWLIKPFLQFTGGFGNGGWEKL